MCLYAIDQFDLSGFDRDIARRLRPDVFFDLFGSGKNILPLQRQISDDHIHNFQFSKVLFRNLIPFENY